VVAVAGRGGATGGGVGRAAAAAGGAGGGAGGVLAASAARIGAAPAPGAERDSGGELGDGVATDAAGAAS
jgi:hypothetical protein